MKAGTYSVTSTFIDRAGGQASVCVHLLSSGLDIRNCLCGREGSRTVRYPLPAETSPCRKQLRYWAIESPSLFGKNRAREQSLRQTEFAGMCRHASSCHPPGGILSSLRLLSPATWRSSCCFGDSEVFPCLGLLESAASGTTASCLDSVVCKPSKKPQPGWQGFL